MNIEAKARYNRNGRTFRGGGASSLLSSSRGGVEGYDATEGVTCSLRRLDESPPASGSVSRGYDGSSGWVLGTKSGSGEEWAAIQ